MSTSYSIATYGTIYEDTSSGYQGKHIFGINALVQIYISTQ